jgi:SWI/SNF-related matrix-associated actin-dependent regulator 1 of chromatin subfamily A
MLTPRPYQIVGRDFLASRRFALLADEMRVGKTPQAILAAHKLGAERIIVACPAIAVPHWNREFARWYDAMGGQILPRLAVMSYDKLRMHGDRIMQQHFDLAIVDECHFAKNPEAQRTKLIYGKGGLGWVADRLWALSGTPAPKHAGELWCMLKAFGVVGLSYEDYVRRYCVLDGMGVIRGTKESMIPELRGLLAKVMLRRTRKEVAPEMPDIDFQFLEVQPEGTDNAFGPRVELPSGLSDSQLADWLEANRNNVDAEDRIAVAMAKAQELVNHIKFAIENNLLQQIVVFGWHVEPLTWLTAELRERGISVGLITGATTGRMREIVQGRFRDGDLQVVAANILAAGTAIDLSSARHAYMLELDWVPGNNLQAVNRMVSMDRMDKVTVDVVTWPGSVDDRVQRVLMRRVRELNQLI